MPVLDASQVELRVFTFKAGLLSRVAHDLELRATSLRMDIDGEQGAPRLDLTVDSAAWQVVRALRKGRELADALSERDKADIVANLRKEVLQSERYPEVRFVSSELEGGRNRWRVHGELTLCGCMRPLQIDVERDGDQWRATFDLHQPEFGITPFSAMLGSLKIQPRVQVQISVATGAVPFAS